MNNSEMPTRGFIYVASVNRIYYELAINSCTTLKDYYPNAHVTLFTHNAFVDDRAIELFDNIVTNIPIHYRAKMWAMARTPYEETVYIDCDSIIVNKDIEKIHDFLSECDLFCGDNQTYTVSEYKLTCIDKLMKYSMDYHGSMWGYKKTPLSIDFMQTWFDEFVTQLDSADWKYESFSYRSWKQFDMFTLWRLITNHFDEGFDRFKTLKIKILPTRWNCSGQTLKKYLTGPKVIMQIDKHTLARTSSQWWSNIMLESNNAKYYISKSKAYKASYEYN